MDATILKEYLNYCLNLPTPRSKFYCDVVRECIEILESESFDKQEARDMKRLSK